MSKLALISLFGLVLAGCAADNRDRGASGGASATTAPPGQNEDMRGSKNTRPGDGGDQQRPAGSPAPRSTY